MSNKQNCMLEIISLIFLVPRDDFPQPQHATLESKEQTYGMLRQRKREFAVAYYAYLIDKLRIKMNHSLGATW